MTWTTSQNSIIFLCMKDLKDIKWISLQPLTGGMHLGFENVIGHPAECIISYKGLNDNKPGKDGRRGHCGNEYNLTNYLRNRGEDVPRLEFQHGMFEMPEDVKMLPDAFTDFDFPDLSNIDIVCAVPVCSGLSALTTTDADDKDKKNCNMKFLAKFALEYIKPSVYIFENAPGFMSDKGTALREWFEEFAWQHHYSIAYFKTDTKLHHNCQRRPRTFVMFIKDCGNAHSRFPELENVWEKETLTIKDVLSRIPKDSPQMDSLPTALYENIVYMEWAKEYVGENWRDWFQGDVMNKIIRQGLLNDFERWCQTTDKVDRKFADRMVKHIEHIEQCLSEGRGWWSASPRFYPELAPAVQSRTIYATIHPEEDRLCNEREMLTLMGMPYNFEMQGAFMSDGPKIGQNVPVRTAEWIARLAVQALSKEYDYRVATDDPHAAPRFWDNTKQEAVR